MDRRKFIIGTLAGIAAIADASEVPADFAPSTEPAVDQFSPDLWHGMRINYVICREQYIMLKRPPTDVAVVYASNFCQEICEGEGIIVPEGKFKDWDAVCAAAKEVEACVDSIHGKGKAIINIVCRVAFVKNGYDYVNPVVIVGGTEAYSQYSGDVRKPLGI